MPLEPEGLKGIQNVLGRPRNAAGSVHVFDPNPPLSLMSVSIQIAPDRGDQGTEMEGA
jgi:hypothetical protein